MKCRLLVLVLSLLACALVSAGTVDPILQGLSSVAPVDLEVPVIVQFHHALAPRVLEDLARREVERRYPHDHARWHEEKKHLKRRLMVGSLQSSEKRSRRRLTRFLKQYGVDIRPMKSLWVRNSVALNVPAFLIDRIAAIPRVERVIYDATIQGPGTGTPPNAPTDWNLTATGVEQIWATGNTGQGIVVASLDTGVDVTHPDLAANYRGGSNSWFDPHGQHAAPADVNGHGTQVMGVLVGNGAYYYQTGMAPEAQWIASKIFDDSNLSTLSVIHQAFQWVLDPDGNPLTDDTPDIVNNSWSLQSTINQCNQEFQADIALLKAADIAVVFAGGNYGAGGDTSVSPANDPGVVSVGSVDNQLNIDTQSSRGAGACDGGIYPRLVAPGANVLTTDRMPTAYNWVSGSSFAVAHVSGAMAVLKSAFPAATVSQIEAALVASATDLGIAGPDDTFGYGMLNVPMAFEWLVSNLGSSTSGALGFGVSGYSIDENVASMSLTVVRSGGMAGTVSVSYVTQDGTATAGQDYQAVSGVLTFADGQAKAIIAVPILDDTIYEGEETVQVVLSLPTGGSSLDLISSTTLTILDDEMPGPVDADSDGYAADVDCNDNDAGIHPGAIEIPHDGIDQDCNGHDLTIDVLRAEYIQKDARDDLVVWTTSVLGSQAGLRMSVTLANGQVVTRNLWWSARQNRWQKQLEGFVAGYGSLPVAARIDGIEGSVNSAITLISDPADADGDGYAADVDCNDNDAGIHPGAIEIAHDGIDQDCNGHDLTIDVLRAEYIQKDGRDDLVVWTTSVLGSQAGLRMGVTLANGQVVTRNLWWSARQNRWQKQLEGFVAGYGSLPVVVRIDGIEGAVNSAITLISDPADADGDGYAADVDCNDNDAGIHPGAIEIAHDGIDQDCNGHDLTIDVLRAEYIQKDGRDDLVVWTTSVLGSQASLRMSVTLANGQVVTRNLWWFARQNRWQKQLEGFVAGYGSLPVAVRVEGVEGTVDSPFTMVP